MAKAFYRTYRPQSFTDLYGQEHVKQTLINAIKSESFAHSYLFSGPRGVGKTTLARIIAKSLNCTNKKEGSADPCNECDRCKAVMSGSAVDIIEIDAASNRGIDEIRSLREKARTAPLSFDYKVFIIDEVHMLTKEAFDALLKTLEEPKKHALFMLATTEFEKIPKTIISRCQTFELRTIPPEELQKYLSHIVKEEMLSLSEEVIKYIVSFSGGYARDATSLLNQVAILDNPSIDDVKQLFGVPLERDVLDLFKLLSEGSLAQAFALIRRIVQEGRDVHHFSRIIQEYARTMMLIEYVDVKAYSYDIGLDEQSLAELTDISTQIGKAQLNTFLTNVIDFEEKLKDSYHPELFIELAVIESFENLGEVSVASKRPQAEKIEKKNDVDTPVVQQDAPQNVANDRSIGLDKIKTASSAEQSPTVSEHAPPPQEEFVTSVEGPVVDESVSSVQQSAPVAVSQDAVQKREEAVQSESVSSSSEEVSAPSADETGEVSSASRSESSVIDEVSSLYSAPSAPPVKAKPTSVQETKKEKVVPVENAQDGRSISTPIETIQSRWDEVVSSISQKNLSLAGMVKSTCVLGIKNGTLVLVADFGFHKDKINDPQNKEVIVESLTSLFREQIHVECEEKSAISDEDRAAIDRTKNAAAAVDKQQREDTFNAAVEVFGVEN